MNRPTLSLLCIGLLFVLTACQPAGQTPGNEMLRPGDVVDGMIMTTGVANVPPLWAFCTSQDEGNTTTSFCNVPSLHDLGIGCIFTMGARKLSEWIWSELTWEFSIDGQAVDLERFGIYETALPAMADNPSPIREVFRQAKTWDVVLTNLKPGQHTLQGVVHTGTDSYTWVIYLTIEGNALGTGAPWVGSDIQVIS